MMAFVALYLLATSVPSALAQPPPGPIAAVVSKVTPAVVRIVTVRPSKETNEKVTSDVAQTASSAARSTAIGSGFLITQSGYIATNKHVVEDAISVFATTADGVRYKASIAGLAAEADMALLKIDVDRPLPVVPFGDSDKMRVGDTVIAIGSPFGFDGSVMAGIVSAVNRDITESPFDDYVQTDAMINHGNSGGPLFNLAGEVVGMNSVIFAPGTGSVGLGFAIPSNDLRFVFDRLMQTGELKAGMLPIRTQLVSWMIAQAIGMESQQGALVAALGPGGDQMMQGHIKPGDVILSFNGQAVQDPRDLARKIARTAIGSDAVLDLYRVGGHHVVHVAVQAWPEAKPPGNGNIGTQSLGLQLAVEAQDGGASGVMVAFVDPSGTAADSGLQKGDVILQVQQEPVSKPEQAMRILQAQSSAKHPFAIVLVERDKKRTWIPIGVPVLGNGQ